MDGNVSRTRDARQLHDAHALVVGISAYSHVNPLPRAVVNDAEKIREALLDPACGGYLDERVKLLRDGEATGAAIRGALEEFKVRCGPGSTALVYFSGHGGSITSGPRAGQYLLPVDVDGSSQDSLADTGISGDELTGLLSTVSAKRLLVILDCCYAGGVGDPKAITPVERLDGFKAGLSGDDYEKLASGEGRVIFAAARRDEVSWVLRHDENSLFTKHLLAGLRGAAASGDGFIRIFELFEYMAKAVRDAGGRQRPVLKCQTEDNFAVALGRRERRADASGNRFTYDVYLTFAPEDADLAYETVIPFLERAGLKVVTSDSQNLDIGGYRVVNVARGIEKSKRTLLMLSPAYLRNHYGTFEAVLAMQLGLDQGKFRLIPLLLQPRQTLDLPLLLRSLQAADYSHRYIGGERALALIVDAVKGPIPSM
ncbi:WD-40 repeat protein [Sorangium cellulosum So ce56]|uniref:WD-40 repeat protein n=1 Tax=Sorangium cellulosum (strain So ce56) TaxID=448385 RepID=A9GJ82_SORC5|nr:caspase family protein [Sorangium cellulosum]CAN93368.1 WD-40 repeat protein [Sorangium cellulosum So ce56]